MSFNYGREEKKWRLWKGAEEKQLRSLGVSEDTIEQLHTHDWAVFNSDRRYYRRLQDAGTYLEDFADETAQPEEAGSAVIKAPLLCGMLRLMDGERVTVQECGGRLVVTSGNAEYAIPVMDAQSYPRMEIPCPAATVPVKGIPLLARRTVFALLEDAARPMLQCVNLIFGADGLQAVSSDSYRIAAARGDRESRGNISILLPATSLEKLAGLVSNTDTLQVGTTGKHIVFTKADFAFSARVMDGAYLSVSQVLSNLRPQFTVLTDAALLRDTISQVLTVCGTQNRFCLQFKDNRLTVRCESELGISETALDAISLSGAPEGTFWYQPKQLLECLKALNGTLMLEVVQHGALLMKTDELTCFQTAARETKAIEKKPEKRRKPPKHAA